ncbi:MAG: hypothetical protein AAGA46_16210, partial [Cyanobacteria bacterium P01_F01_bin.13]
MVQNNSLQRKHAVSGLSLSGGETAMQFASGLGQDFSQLPVSSTPLPFIQTKLTVGQPNDKYEQEADRVAEQVMRMPVQFYPQFLNGADRTPDQQIGQGANYDYKYLKSGTIKKITYPTGGSSTFDFEAHDFANPSQAGSDVWEEKPEINLIACAGNSPFGCNGPSASQSFTLT